jgi:hypothetical protein
MQYESDNTRYPNPCNIFEAITLWWNNLWDEEYQESKRRYERLHSHDDCKLSKSEKSKQFKAMKASAKQMKGSARGK